jgi:hypothetical protein
MRILLGDEPSFNGRGILGGMKALALVGALVALVVPLAPTASTSSKPVLRVLEKAPLVLQGTGFEQAEWVKVTVSTEPRVLSQWKHASRVGSFVARFDTVVDACYGAKAASAVGKRGSKAVIALVRPWERYCVEPGTPP